MSIRLQSRNEEKLIPRKLFLFLIFFSYIILWITVSYQFFAKKILVFVLIYRNLCIFATAKQK